MAIAPSLVIQEAEFAQFEAYVRDIEQYNGPDPLQPWYTYLLWIERTFVINYKQDDVVDAILAACLLRFEYCRQYYQDRRLIKIFIKYIQFRAEGPHFYFKMLHEKGVGTKVADLYVNWAFDHWANGDYTSADKTYARGLNAGAEPSSVLNTEICSFRQFMSRHRPTDEILLDAQKVDERLTKLSTLELDQTSSKQSRYSISTLNTAKLMEICLPKCSDDSIVEDKSPAVTGNLNTSIVHSIKNSARKYRRTPYKPRNVTSCRLDFNDDDQSSPFRPNGLTLPALGANENMYELGVQLPPNWAPKNRPQTTVRTRPFVDRRPEPGAPFVRKEYHYDKLMLCPANDKAFSTEELLAYKWFKKRSIENAFTIEQDKVWGVGYDVPIRFPSLYCASANLPQRDCDIPRKREEDILENEISAFPFQYSYDHGQHYPAAADEEFSIEELMYQKRLVRAAYANGERPIAKELIEQTRNPDVGLLIQKIDDEATAREAVLVTAWEASHESGAARHILGDEKSRLNVMKNERRSSELKPSMKRSSSDLNSFQEPIDVKPKVKLAKIHHESTVFYACGVNPALNAPEQAFDSFKHERSDNNWGECSSIPSGSIKVEPEAYEDVKPLVTLEKMHYESAVFDASAVNPAVNAPERAFEIFTHEQSVNNCDENVSIATSSIKVEPEAFVDKTQDADKTIGDVSKSSASAASKSFFTFDWEDDTEQFEINETRAQNSPVVERDEVLSQSGQPYRLSALASHSSGQVSHSSEPTLDAFNVPQPTDAEKSIEPIEDLDETIGRSIYVQTPELDDVNEEENDWAEVTAFLLNGPTENEYQIGAIDLDETRNRIDTYLLDWKGLNPFDDDFRMELLNERGFIDAISNTSHLNFETVHIVQPLRPRFSVSVAGAKIMVRKVIGTGQFGKVFSGEDKATQLSVALKQQRPPNLWELYVCLEVQSRIKTPAMRGAFMAIDRALVGNNSTIYVSKLAKYGTLLDVCNVVKKSTGKNGLDECIVMILAKQMFSMVRHLHDINIIHADVKPDNFLLMEKLSTDLHSDHIALQLIDFGQSIDLTQFPANQVFFTKVKTQNFVCTEMMNDKPWKYQHDLFCVASTIYTLLTGKYMEVSRYTENDPYRTQKLPRYVNADFWDGIFGALINIPNARHLPSLQEIEEKLHGQLVESNQRRLIESITRFNSALDQ